MKARALEGILLLCVAAHAPAQEAGRPTSLHKAWLREIMDLDVAGAAADYRTVGESRPGNLERWVAVARLAELSRLGALPAGAPTAGDVPLPLRPAFQATQTALPLDELVLRCQLDPAQALQVLATDAGRLPPLRTAVPAAEEWLMGQIGPSLRDRMRQRMEAMANRPRSNEAGRFTDRLYAADIVRAELQGRTAQASALRTLYFSDWRAPAAKGDPLALLARVKTNLAAWLRDGDLGAQQQALLRELEEALDQKGAAELHPYGPEIMPLDFYQGTVFDTWAKKGKKGTDAETGEMVPGDR